jgi:predicted PurR-regulated permease PerM
MSVAIAAFLRPFVALLILALVLYPTRRFVSKRMKEGRLKRILLFRISKGS